MKAIKGFGRVQAGLLILLAAAAALSGAACDSGWEVKPIVAPIGGAADSRVEPAVERHPVIPEVDGAADKSGAAGQEGRRAQDPAERFRGDWRLVRFDGVDDAMKEGWRQAGIDFELRFGPETLKLIIRQGQQAMAGMPADTEIPYRVEVGAQGNPVATIVPPGVKGESLSFVLEGEELHMGFPQQPMRLVFARIGGALKAP